MSDSKLPELPDGWRWNEHGQAVDQDDVRVAPAVGRGGVEVDTVTEGYAVIPWAVYLAFAARHAPAELLRAAAEVWRRHDGSTGGTAVDALAADIEYDDDAWTEQKLEALADRLDAKGANEDGT